jgi:hypothetical protein
MSKRPLLPLTTTIGHVKTIAAIRPPQWNYSKGCTKTVYPIIIVIITIINKDLLETAAGSTNISAV